MHTIFVTHGVCGDEVTAGALSASVARVCITSEAQLDVATLQVAAGALDLYDATFSVSNEDTVEDSIGAAAVAACGANIVAAVGVALVAAVGAAVAVAIWPAIVSES